MSRKELIIWCWDKCKIDPGHIAIQIEKCIYGFTFRGETYPGPEIGEIKKETEAQLAEWYIKHHVKEYMRQAIKKGADANPGSREVYLFTLEIPLASYDLLRDRYEFLHENPLIYDRRLNNCVTTTITEFSLLNLLNFQKTPWPPDFLSQLRKRLEEPQDESARVIKEECARINYNYEKGLHWVKETVLGGEINGIEMHPAK